MQGYFKLNEDGSLQTANKQHDGFESFDKLAKDSDGNLYSHYELVADGEGIYQANSTAIQNSNNEKRIAEIDTRLDEIDKLSARALRSKAINRGNAQDDSTLALLDDEAILLRDERVALQGG